MADKLRGKIEKATKRSSMKNWMISNRAWLAGEIERAAPVDWVAVARMLNDEHQLRDAKGNPPNADSVRMAWKRIATSRSKVPPPRPAPVQAPPPSPAVPVTPPPLPQPATPTPQPATDTTDANARRLAQYDTTVAKRTIK